ncbi:MAG TPA: hypothetical protein VFA29_14515 [Candidatus Baltobacteraceae bacterium]|nr:hypothetical protein [Candidatus Baltobacteraceae bacterium]
MEFPPRGPRGSPSFEICPSCGFEFGYHDDLKGYSYEEWRKKWIQGGMKFWSKRDTVPRDWDPVAQLRAAGLTGDEDDF